jgi:hypothetical protein
VTEAAPQFTVFDFSAFNMMLLFSIVAADAYVIGAPNFYSTMNATTPPFIIL